MGSEKVGMRKVLLGRVWAKMNLSEKMVWERDISVEIRDLRRNWVGFFWEKKGVRKGLVGRKEGF